MGITLDNSIRLLEDYHEWEKKHGLDDSGVDDATKKLLEVAKKYQKIEQIVNDKNINGDLLRMSEIRWVLEDGDK